MKANAPEKIYINGFSCFAEEPVKEGVEYIRTDAFIDKALAYLHNKFYFNNVFYGIVNTDFNAMEEMYEDFRNYIKE